MWGGCNMSGIMALDIETGNYSWEIGGWDKHSLFEPTVVATWDGNDGHVDGGIDTKTAEQVVAKGCSITLPRIENGNYISLLDECGGHTNEYHFHERLTCLYDGEKSGHSDEVGVEYLSAGLATSVKNSVYT